MTSGGGIRKNTLGPGINVIATNYPDVVKRGLMQETQIETTEAKKRTPVDKGPLRASVHAEGAFERGRTIYSAIVAGGPSAPYAEIVHEDPDAFHPVGQWKYIESVIMESKAFFGSRVATRIQLMEALKAVGKSTETKSVARGLGE